VIEPSALARYGLRMRKVHVIGIGAGDPDHLTVQAVRALNEVDVFFLIGKGEVKDDLAALRTQILTTHVPTRNYRLVEARDPERDRGAGSGEGAGSEAYRAAVVDWQDRRAEIYARMITDELGDDGVGAFLVWGDPSLYDGTLRLLERIRAAGTDFQVTSIPGISSVQALAAAHRLILNRIGRPVLITTGRRIAQGMPTDVDDVVVMLDGGTAFAELPDAEAADLDIYWGAYLGTPDELLCSGPLLEVRDEIVATRASVRARKGWIMDTYLLRRNAEER
jgi:precorrin-6A synthase